MFTQVKVFLATPKKTVKIKVKSCAKGLKSRAFKNILNVQLLNSYKEYPFQ